MVLMNNQSTSSPIKNGSINGTIQISMEDDPRVLVRAGDLGIEILKIIL